MLPTLLRRRYSSARQHTPAYLEDPGGSSMLQWNHPGWSKHMGRKTDIKIRFMRRSALRRLWKLHPITSPHHADHHDSTRVESISHAKWPSAPLVDAQANSTPHRLPVFFFLLPWTLSFHSSLDADTWQKEVCSGVSNQDIRRDKIDAVPSRGGVRHSHGGVQTILMHAGNLFSTCCRC